ncbi:MAG: DUF501 domain-containing protein [Proteobacteria bacterium]|nr:DUF501 domain-containing protein [Pseudomonadota bacterium]
MDDRSVVELQIGRPARSRVDVRTRCHLGLPVVIDVPPLLDDGTPFPTMFWLTCPLATLRTSRIESGGGVRAADERNESDAAVAERFAAAMKRYEHDRDALLPEGWDGPKPSGGVAGSSSGVKCLHAHYADTAAGNDNPVGEVVAERIEPLACTVPCVVSGDNGVELNRQWIEPR